MLLESIIENLINANVILLAPNGFLGTIVSLERSALFTIILNLLSSTLGLQEIENAFRFMTETITATEDSN